MNNNKNQWINSGRMPKIFGLINWYTVAIFLVSIFIGLFFWVAIISLVIDFLEYKFKMNPLELFRSVMVRFGLLFSYKGSRELGPSARAKEGTFFYGNANFNYRFLGIFTPTTLLSIYICVFSILAAYISQEFGYEYSVFNPATAFFRLMGFIFALASIALIAMNLHRYITFALTKRSNNLKEKL